MFGKFFPCHFGCGVNGGAIFIYLVHADLFAEIYPAYQLFCFPSGRAVANADSLNIVLAHN